MEEEIARKGLLMTSNHSVESAITWIMDHRDDPDIELPIEKWIISNAAKNRSPSITVGQEFQTIEYKVVFCVRTDLKMSVGKIAAQCAHAGIGIYKRIHSSSKNVLEKWERSGQKKVVVSIDNDLVMNHLEKLAIHKNLPTYKVTDAGRTEIEPMTPTVLAIAGPDYLVDEVTGNLNLLK